MNFFKNLFIYICKNIPDDKYLKIIYYFKMNKKLDLKNPKTFNEKLQWLKLYDRKPIYTDMVDKYKVREYVSKTIGDEYLIPLLGVWDKFEDIDFSELPEKFVLKTNHDSGTVIICKNKNNFDIKSARNKIKKSLKRNYYWAGREWPYKNVEPKIIAEEYIVNELDFELKDYKFLSFNGNVENLFVCSNRNSKKELKVDFYDLEWNLLPFERHYKRSGIKMKKPNNFDKMLEISNILSKNTKFLRVDLYESNNKIYFGELTFYPGSGMEEFIPEEYDRIMGELLNLNND